MQEKLRFQAKVTFMWHIIHLPGDFFCINALLFHKKPNKISKKWHLRFFTKKSGILQKLSHLDSLLEGEEEERGGKFTVLSSLIRLDGRSFCCFKPNVLVQVWHNFKKKHHFCMHHNINIIETLFITNLHIIQMRTKRTKTLKIRLKWGIQIIYFR